VDRKMKDGKALSVYINKNNTIKHISVVGELSLKADIKYLCSLLLQKDDYEIQLSFLDANVIPVEVIEAIVKVQRIKKCRVFVLQQCLYSYLFNLGINCSYIRKKSISKGKTSNIDIININDIPKDDVIIFLEQVHKKYGYDYTKYQIDSIVRRIKITMLRENIKDFSIFKDAVLTDYSTFEQLFLDLSINTTEFFRDSKVFAFIRDQILPSLNLHSYIKIWCAGCSTGQEPYSLAIMLHELGMLSKTQIYATDINPYVIYQAKNGLFSTENIDLSINNYRNSNGCESFIDYFNIKDNYIQVKDHIKKNILFFQHNIANGGVLNEFHLILCRNVLIYFNDELQENALKLFSRSLYPDGYLVLGKSEGMLSNNGLKYFDKYNEKYKVYKNKCL
jgi:chemotaxis protein methyltransferase CheR